VTWPDDEPLERRLAEGHAVQDTAKMTRKPDSGKPVPRPLVDEELPIS